MSEEVSRKRRRILGARRMLLLATTIAGLGAALVLAPNLSPGITFHGAQAQNLTAQVDREAAFLLLAAA